MLDNLFFSGIIIYVRKNNLYLLAIYDNCPLEKKGLDQMDIDGYNDTDKMIIKYLVKDYTNTIKDLRTLVDKEELHDYEKDDLIFNLKLKKAFEVLFEYYMIESERKKIIQEI